jgi:prepilin-type N-terminal cleavage/methylation domain-containing protein
MPLPYSGTRAYITRSCFDAPRASSYDELCEKISAASMAGWPSPRIRADLSRVCCVLSRPLRVKKISPGIRMRKMTADRARGFSLIEMMMVLAIGLIATCVAILSLQPAIKDARTNAAYDTVLMQMRNTRERAIENREQFIVCFGVNPPAGALTPLGAPDAQSIQVFQWPSGTAISSAVQVNTLDLPFDILFQAQSGIPTSPNATPDGFGTGNVAIDFDIGVAGGNANQIMFMPDGSARDVNGNYNNGVVYVGRTGDIYSTRAVSVFGASGRIRGWRLVSNSNTPEWIQQ